MKSEILSLGYIKVLRRKVALEAPQMQNPFIGLSYTIFRCGSFLLNVKKNLTVGIELFLASKIFFIPNPQLEVEKKSAQNSILSIAIDRKTMFPVDWCIQIVFLIF